MSCWACETVCPSRAVEMGERQFRINPRRCDECAGAFAEPQCASICPVEGAILNALGEALHAPGSLTGISPAMQVAWSAGEAL